MDEKKVQTLARALDIIEVLAVARDGLGVTELGQRTGLHKSTVYRLLSALAERGYVEKHPKNAIYKLGLKFIEISGLFLKQLELKTEALPFMRRLAEIIGQPVHLAIREGPEVIYIEKVESVNSIRMYSQIGRRVPVYCSAIGKILLTGLTKEELANLLSQLQLKRFTANTLISRELLQRDIEKVSLRGWASDDEEHEAGIRCIAAPIYDYTGKIIAAISISGEKRVIRPERDDEFASEVQKTADQISRRMGYVGFRV